jgi:hypothetical protein
MMLSRLKLTLLIGFVCAALLGASYLVPASPIAAPAPLEPNAGAGNGTAPVTQQVEFAGTPGSDVKYPTRIESPIGGKQVKLALTGTALRKKVIVNVYTIGSYVEEGVAVASADELGTKDCAKQLHLVMETNVSGKQMAEAFTDAIRANYPKPKFDVEIGTLVQKLRVLELAKGDHVWITAIPGQGVRIDVVGKAAISIDGTAFAQAMWEIYLGKKNIGEAIKTALVSRLK